MQVMQRKERKMGVFKIELGVKVTDSITGFKGIVTGRSEYITGCKQYSVVPKAEKNKAASAAWFDEDRLVGSVKKKAAKKPRGGPQQFAAPLK